jgi:hypothetical protein
VWALAALLAACEDGPNDETVVDELTVLAMVAQPPEVGPGETLDLDVWVVDPAGAGVDLLVWACTPVGEQCAETAVLSAPLSTWSRVWRGVSGPQRASFPIPVEAGLVIEPPAQTTSFFVWALACAPGVCDLHRRVELAPPPGSPAWSSVVEELADPTSQLDGRPIEVAALSVRRLVLSIRPPGERNLPPTLLRVGDEPLFAAPGEELVLAFQVTDATLVWPYATAGGFEYARYAVSQGTAGMRWVAPDQPGPVELYVVADDGLGGAAIWAGVAQVGL